MKLVEVSNSEARCGSKWRAVISEFMESGFDAAEIQELDGNLINEYHSLNNYIRRSGVPVRCRTHSGKLYLTREVQSE